MTSENPPVYISWTVDYIVSVYYFSEANTHLWDVIFCQQE